MFVSHKKPKYKQYLSIDESVGLHKNYSFRLAIFLPVVISIFFIIIFSIQLAIEGQFRLSITQPEVNAFIRYFSFPISLSSLSVVFGVMVARFHSSKQKAKSNEITERNNSVNYFYKTHEEFEKYCQKLVESNECKFYRIRADIVYRLLFEHSIPESPSLVVGEQFHNKMSKVFDVYAAGVQSYFQSEQYIRSKGEDMSAPRKITGSASLLLNNSGLYLKGFGTVYELEEIEKQLMELYSSLNELVAFPGLVNRSDSIEVLTATFLRNLKAIQDHPEIKEINLQTPQS